jgi:hypothetical protein
LLLSELVIALVIVESPEVSPTGSGSVKSLNVFFCKSSELLGSCYLNAGLMPTEDGVFREIFDLGTGGPVLLLILKLLTN